MAREASTITQYGRPVNSSGERIHIQPPYRHAPAVSASRKGASGDEIPCAGMRAKITRLDAAETSRTVVPNSRRTADSVG